MMQYFVLKNFPHYAMEEAGLAKKGAAKEEEEEKGASGFTRVLNSLLDGGRTGVDVGIAIIPGVLIISSLVMLLTFGHRPTDLIRAQPMRALPFCRG